MQKDYFTISIPIHTSVNPSKLLRLMKICKRDRAAKKDLFYIIIDGNGGILKRFQDKKNSKKLDSSSIDNYFYPHHSKTPSYNFQMYHPCYKREFQEIRKEVDELILSYVTLSRTNYKNGNPYTRDLRRPGTRRMNYQRPNGKKLTSGTSIVRQNESKLTYYWLEIYDIFNKDHLRLPLKCYKGLQKFFSQYGISFDLVKTVTIVKKKYRENNWIANFTFDMDDVSHKRARIIQNDIITSPPKIGNQSILSIDAGERIPYVGIFITPLGLRQDLIRYYKIPETQKQLHFLDLRISDLEQKLNNKINTNKRSLRRVKLLKLHKSDKSNSSNKSYKEYLDKDIKKLKQTLAEVRKKWFNIRKEAEEQLSNQIIDELVAWKEKGWDVKLVVGDLTGIREMQMPYLTGKNHKRKFSRWMYRKRIEILRRKCVRAGIEFNAINEEFTSHTCPNCGVTEFRRASGSKKRRTKIMKDFAIQRSRGYFRCNQCLWSGNADLVGAINIARKFLVEHYQADEKVLKQALKREYFYYQNELFRRKLEKNPDALKPETAQWDWIKKQKITSNLKTSKSYKHTRSSRTSKKRIEVSLNKFRLKWFDRPHTVPKSLSNWVQSIRIPAKVNS